MCSNVRGPARGFLSPAEFLKGVTVATGCSTPAQRTPGRAAGTVGSSRLKWASVSGECCLIAVALCSILYVGWGVQVVSLSSSWQRKAMSAEHRGRKWRYIVEGVKMMEGKNLNRQTDRRRISNITSSNQSVCLWRLISKSLIFFVAIKVKIQETFIQCTCLSNCAHWTPLNSLQLI